MKSDQGDVLRSASSGRSKANLSLVDLQRILFKHRFMVLSILAASLIISFIYAKTRVRLYEASSTAEIDRSRADSMQLGGGFFGYEDPDTALQTEMYRITGDALIFRAAGELGVEHKGPFPDAFKGVSLPITDDSLPSEQRLNIINTIKGRTTVSVVPKTNAIRIEYLDPDPVVARDFVNKLLTVYTIRNMEDKVYISQQSAAMLAPQLQELLDHMSNAQRALAQYEGEHKFIGNDASDTTDTSGSNLNVTQLKALNDQLSAAQADQMVKKARLQLVESTNPENLYSVAPTPALQSLRSQLETAKAKLTELRTKYGSGYPAVHELEMQIPEIEKEITAESNNVKRRVQEDYDTSSSTVRSVQERMDEQLQQISKLNEGAAQHALLREDAEASRDLYNALELKLKESSVTAAFSAAAISVIDHAVVKPTAVVPNVRRMVLTGGLLGLILAVFLVLGLEALDDTIETSEDIEASSGLHSLGAIPHFEPQPELVDGIPSESVAPGRLVTLNAKDSIAAEAFRAIRSAILLSDVDSPKKCILITSSLMAEGKSTLSSNLAVALAQRGARVLLVDTDLRRGTLGSIFELGDSLPGLSNILGRLDEGHPYLHPIASLPTLTFLPTGIKVPNPAELLASNRMASLMAEWRENYDHVVLDGAPVLMVSDSLPIAAMSDGVLLVARSGTTRKAAFERSRALLSRSNATILGAVVNDVDLRLEHYYTYSNKTYGYGEYGKNGKAYGSPYGSVYGADRKEKK